MNSISLLFFVFILPLIFGKWKKPVCVGGGDLVSLFHVSSSFVCFFPFFLFLFLLLLSVSVEVCVCSPVPFRKHLSQLANQYWQWKRKKRVWKVSSGPQPKAKGSKVSFIPNKASRQTLFPTHTPLPLPLRKACSHPRFPSPSIRFCSKIPPLSQFQGFLDACCLHSLCSPINHSHWILLYYFWIWGQSAGGSCFYDSQI